MRSMIGTTLTALAALATSASLATAADVEVLHWWTSGGEASALNVLRDDLAAQNIGWHDQNTNGITHFSSLLGDRCGRLAWRRARRPAGVVRPQATGTP